MSGVESKMLRRASGDKQVYISRAVNGPDNRKMIVPGALPWLHSMVNLVLFQIWATVIGMVNSFRGPLLFNSRPNVPWQDALDPGGRTTHTGVSAKR